MQKLRPHLGFIVFFCFASCISAHAAETYVPKAVWPVLEQDWYFGYPNYVTTDKDDNVYVANYGVLKFSPAGELLQTWGSTATGTEELKQVGGIDVDDEGNVYMTDYANHFVQISTPSGDTLARWGTYGSTPGKFNTPMGIAVDSQGRVIVADSGNKRLQVFNSQGALQQVISNDALNLQIFSNPSDIILDTAGLLYADDGIHIHIFDDNLTYSKTITKPPVLGPLTDIDKNSIFYFIGYDSICRCSFSESSFTILSSITEDIKNPSCASVNGNGIVYVSMELCGSIFTGKKMRVSAYSPTGELLTTWESTGSEPGQFFYPTDIALAPDGNLYIMDTYNNRVQHFTSAGEFIRAWGEPGSDPGQFNRPENIAVDGSGNVYTREQYSLEFGFRLQKFNSTGEFLMEIPIIESYLPPLSVSSMDVDSDGNIFLTDKTLYSIIKLDPSGKELAHLGEMDMDEPVSYPSAVTVGPDDSVYLGDRVLIREGDRVYGHARIQHLSAELKQLNSWMCEPLDRETSTSIHDLAIDDQGNVFITEGFSNAIRKYSSQGELLGVWGGSGTAPGKFRSPNGLEITPDGDLYVVDQMNSRIQVLEPVDIPDSAYAGWWWEGSEKSGTGVSIEVQGDTVYLAWYGYDETGLPVWYSSLLQKSGLIYKGSLYIYTGWPLDTDNPDTGYAGEFLGYTTLTFSSTTEATLVYKAGDREHGKRLSRYWDGEPDTRDLHGWWFDPARDGMGLFIEARGGRLFASWFHYGDTGSPRWWISIGDFGQTASEYSGQWLEYAGGQTFTGNYASPGDPEGKGAVSLTLLEDETIRMDWNDRSYSLQRFNFGSR